MIFRIFHRSFSSHLVGIPSNPNAQQELIAAYREILDKAASLNTFYGQSLRSIYQEKLNKLPEELEIALVSARDELSLIEQMQE